MTGAATVPAPVVPAVVIWWVPSDDASDEALGAAGRIVLPPDERAELTPVRDRRRRRERILGRILARQLLASGTGIAPERLAFRRTDHGRPELLASADDWRFSVTHTRGLVACAITTRCSVGIDAEQLGRRFDPRALAQRFFTAREVRALAPFTDSTLGPAVLARWTLKEACLKAIGIGLTVEPDQVAFELAADGTIAAWFGDAIDDVPAAWSFGLLRPTAEHVMAVAVRSARQPAIAMQRMPVERILRETGT